MASFDSDTGSTALHKPEGSGFQQVWLCRLSLYGNACTRGMPVSPALLQVSNWEASAVTLGQSRRGVGRFQHSHSDKHWEASGVYGLGFRLVSEVYKVCEGQVGEKISEQPALLYDGFVCVATLVVSRCDVSRSRFLVGICYICLLILRVFVSAYTDYLP